MDMIETWRKVPFLNETIEVSNFGRIRNIKTNRMRATPTSKRGYPVFSIKENGKQRLITVHRCVASAFIPNPTNLPQVNHKDGDKTNNKVSNLEWVSSRENMIHARTIGLHVSDGDKAVMQIKDGRTVAIYKSMSEASRVTGINRGNIASVCRNYVTKDGRKHLTAGGYVWKMI